MGYGRILVCSNCKKEYRASWGVGFSFPEEYEKTLSDIRKGKYGDGMKAISHDEKHIAVDAEEYLYICGKCNAWKVEKGLSLYTPKNLKLLMMRRYGDKTVEWREAPYVMKRELQGNYSLVKRYVHKCDKCGGIMHLATEDEELNLSCPGCGGAPDPEKQFGILWD